MGELRKSSVKSDPTKKEKKIKSVPKSILEAFENIVDMAKDSNLDEKIFKKAGNQIEYATVKMGLTPTQIVLFALFIDNSEDYRIRISDLSNFIGCRTTRILRLTDYIEVLDKKRYIRSSKCDRSVHSVYQPMCWLYVLRVWFQFHHSIFSFLNVLLSLFHPIGLLLNIYIQWNISCIPFMGYHNF